MGTGPEVRDGYDVCLSELDDGFVVRVATAAGRTALAELPLQPASDTQQAGAQASVARVREQMPPTIPTDGLPERLIAAAQSPRWAEIAERCLACTNCTLVCPTCFCTSVASTPISTARRHPPTAAGTRASRSTSRVSRGATSAPASRIATGSG